MTVEATINKALNLVLPIYPFVEEADTKKLDPQPYAYIHSAPIMTETFDMYCEPLGSAYNSIIASEIGQAAPLMAKQLIVKAAQRMGLYENNDRVRPRYIGIEDGLFAEIYRLTNIIVKNKEGSWTTKMWADGQSELDPDDLRDAESAICFFTVASRLYPRRDRRAFLTVGLGMFGGRLESLNCMAFAASLRTSTMVETIGQKVEDLVTRMTEPQKIMTDPIPIESLQPIMRALS
jgi:hypothetical protein